MKNFLANVKGFFHCDWKTLWETSDWWEQENTVDKKHGYEFKVRFSPYLNKARMLSNYIIDDDTTIEKKMQYLAAKKDAYTKLNEYREQINPQLLNIL